MSRIASFNLYKCLDCSQVHTRPVWGTYRVGSPPKDWGTSAEVLKTCVGCGVKKPIFEYQHVAKTVGSGNSREIVWLVATAAPAPAKQTLLMWLTSAFREKESLLDRYPAFKD
jgi:hypothetical protein